MRIFFCLVIIIMALMMITKCEVMNSTVNKMCSNQRTNLSFLRKRRHLTFPDESYMVLTISLVKAFMTHAPSGWNIALEIDVLFPLPDDKFTNSYFRRKIHHRQKREFWEKLEHAIDLYNLNGHSCILRSICETKTYLAPRGKSLVHDILRALFTAPLQDEEFKEEIRGTYNELSDPKLCDVINDCPFSLLDFVLTLNKPVY